MSILDNKINSKLTLFKNLHRTFEQVEEKIQNEEYKLTLKPRAKSQCWTLFKLIRNADGSRIITNSATAELVRCGKCKLIKRINTLSGTTPLLEHTIKCNSDNALKFGEVSSDEKKIFTRKCTLYCAEDLRPMKSLKHNGLLNLLQAAIDLQSSRTTRINARDLVPDPTTISRHLPGLEKEVKEPLKLLLKANHDDNMPAYTLDLWQDLKKEVKLF